MRAPVLSAVLFSAAGLVVSCRSDQAPAAEAPPATGESRAVEYPNPRPKPDFTLTATDGTPFAFRRDTEGYLTLLFFGYTSCPDVCPVHMANLAAALHKLPDRISRRVKVVFVTTDPERDTPERLRAWLDHFDKGFVGLTGTAAEIDSTQRLLRLPPAVREDIGEGRYLVGHVAHIIVFTRDGLGRFAFPFGTRQADWARELPALVEIGAGS
ncbi:MAG TPA: SCO family protein [Gemmatimonadales bacterium]|nr:SCO family protein [Gemmatimonadales bacterium]